MAEIPVQGNYPGSEKGETGKIQKHLVSDKWGRQYHKSGTNTRLSPKNKLESFGRTADGGRTKVIELGGNLIGMGMGGT